MIVNFFLSDEIPKAKPLTREKYVLFVGNPGVGKSTMLNCIMNLRCLENLSNENKFKSGLSYGSGMTFQLDIKKLDDVTYMDTPGLEDTKKRKEAAQAITEALKKVVTIRLYLW